MHRPKRGLRRLDWLAPTWEKYKDRVDDLCTLFFSFRIWIHISQTFSSTHCEQLTVLDCRPHLTHNDAKSREMLCTSRSRRLLRMIAFCVESNAPVRYISDGFPHLPAMLFPLEITILLLLSLGLLSFASSLALLPAMKDSTHHHFWFAAWFTLSA